MKACKILVIDHDPEFLSDMEETILDMRHEVMCKRSMSEGMAAAAEKCFEVVIVNLEMPDGFGQEGLRKLREISPVPEILIVSDSGDPDGAEFAIRNGAWDYIEKPKAARNMALQIVRLVEYLGRRTIETRVRQVLKRETYDGIAGKSVGIKSCLEEAALAADSDANVLISGETGTGKELFAWAIHNNSQRANQQFVVVDCASLPPNLVESTLFGYEKGAFTGADRPHKGLIKRADGGTLFLDEVGELPMSIQKSFLRVLQERRFRPVGGNKEVRSDFRLIAATNRKLETMVKRRQFRNDLLYRLRTFSMELPPLREHLEDLRDISVQQMKKLVRAHGVTEKSFSPDFFDVLERYGWPGNVRELVNALERAISAAKNDPILFPKHLPTYIRVQLARESITEDKSPRGGPDYVVIEPPETWPKLAEARDTAIANTERNYLKALMVHTRGDIKKALGVSGLSRSRLYALLKKHGVHPLNLVDQD